MVAKSKFSVPNMIKLMSQRKDFCVIDLETEGFSPKFAQIIEVGIVKVIDGKIVEIYDTKKKSVNPDDVDSYDEINSLICPPDLAEGRLTPEEYDKKNDTVYKVSRIKGEMLLGNPTWKEVAQDVRDFIGDHVLVAHNASFEMNFLDHFFNSAGVETISYDNLFCTLRTLKKVDDTNRKEFKKSFSLTAITEDLGFVNYDAHRALWDVDVTIKLLAYMIERYADKEEKVFDNNKDDSKKKFSFELKKVFKKLQSKSVNFNGKSIVISEGFYVEILNTTNKDCGFIFYDIKRGKWINDSVFGLTKGDLKSLLKDIYKDLEVTGNYEFKKFIENL